MDIRKFDLNIEKILEDWEIHHAIREIIANAVDEKIITNTKDIEIFKDEDKKWHIRDFGRGLKYEHLTQKENQEKSKNSSVIGKFGIGLKDALATFDRKGVKVFIKSRYGNITISKSEKHGFNNIITLHADIHPSSDPNFIGTEFIMEGCTETDIAKAKDLFLIFSGDKNLERTQYGDVLEKKGNIARIYVNGVKVAEEDDFLFSYNITHLNSAIRKALNRERTNVGRTAYSGSIKSTLLSCKSKIVAERLVNDLKGYESGTIHDEIKWTDVSIYACRLLNSFKDVAFFTPKQLTDSPMMVDEAKAGGYEIITIPDSIRDRISGMRDVDGNKIRDLNQFTKEYNESFEFKFIDEKGLTPKEIEIFKLTDDILSLIGGKPKRVSDIKVSETMRIDSSTLIPAAGLWEPSNGRIIIKRSELRSIKDYAGTLIHEASHAISGALDVNRDFELQLSSTIGIIVSKYIQLKYGTKFLSDKTIGGTM